MPPRIVDPVDVIEIQRYFKVSWPTALVRLRQMNAVTHDTYVELEASVRPVSLARSLGYAINPEEEVRNAKLGRIQRFPRSFLRMLRRAVVTEVMSPPTAAAFAGLALPDIVHDPRPAVRATISKRIATARGQSSVNSRQPASSDPSRSPAARSFLLATVELVTRVIYPAAISPQPLRWLGAGPASAGPSSVLPGAWACVSPLGLSVHDDLRSCALRQHVGVVACLKNVHSSIRGAHGIGDSQ